MIRAAIKILGIVLALVVGLWGVHYLTWKPITEKEAERIASEQVHRSGQQLGFDPSIFQGPALVQVDRGGYAFQWRYSDPMGAVEMLVWVDEYGGSEISWKGDLEQLRAKRGDAEGDTGSGLHR